MIKKIGTLLTFPAILLFLTLPARGEAPVPASADPIMDKIKLEQRLGEPLPLDLEFQNADDDRISLDRYFGDKPVILAPVYYRCPMLCGLILNGLLKALKGMNLDAGKDFEIVTFSIDPEETPGLASKKKEEYLKRYDRPGAETAWHFLTSPGNERPIQALTRAVGFGYAYDEESQEYAHPSAIVIATPDGVISRYFTGIEFPSRDLKFALMEASGGKIGSVVDQILLRCYHYDPMTGRYGLAITWLLRIAGVATVLILGGLIAFFLKKEKQTAGRPR